MNDYRDEPDGQFGENFWNEELDDFAFIETTPHNCENCKWLVQDGWSDYFRCNNISIKLSTRVPTDFVPPIGFGCNQWEDK